MPDNPISAAARGMTKGTKKLNLVKKAEEAGFTGVANYNGFSFKFFGCANCRANTAIRFVNMKTKQAYLACHCGWRKKGKV
jgi:hypothetical protein